MVWAPSANERPHRGGTTGHEGPLLLLWRRLSYDFRLRCSSFFLFLEVLREKACLEVLDAVGWLGVEDRLATVLWAKSWLGVLERDGGKPRNSEERAGYLGV